MSEPHVTLGLERALAAPPDLLRGARFGLLMNQASVDARFRYAHTLLAARFPGQLAALFSPQHGLWSEQQDNMVESPHGRLADVRVYSLYGDTRVPKPHMLEGLDCLLVDLQDVGTRVYTFIWTVSHCLEACAAAGIPVVVLDRPNPLGGVAVEGPLLDIAYESFVGRAAIPMRHALTIGELTRYVNQVRSIGADVHVVPMDGWRRAMRWRDTQRTWVPPSPNLPRVEGVDVYPGQVLLEGTNLSEGRGTTTPFEVCGAPFIDPERLVEALGAHDLPGVTFRPLRFEPTFQKWSKQSCGGVFVHVLDKGTFLPYRTTLAILAAVRELWPAAFAWRPPPGNEYEERAQPIDILTGGSAVRVALDAGAAVADVARLASVDVADWWARAHDSLLYR